MPRDSPAPPAAVSVPGQRTSPGPADGPAVDATEAADVAQGPPGLALWLVNVVEEGDAASALAPDLLDDDEQKRAAAFVRAKDTTSYVSSHVALRLLLGARLGIPPESLEFVREPCPTCGEAHGRPAVAGGALHFSLSHSGQLALIGVAPVTVGVDVEQTPGLKVATDTGRMLHPDESAELAALPDDTRAEAFGRAWVRKEAYLKALGTGLSRNLALDYVGTRPIPAQDLPGWTMTDIRAPQGYLAAAAVRNPLQ